MTSWGGTSIVTVLRSTLTILSTNGSRTKSPGPFGPPWTRPSLKMTPRSYSVTILIALSTTETTNTAITTRAMNPMPKPTACSKPKLACMRDPPPVLVLQIHGLAVAGPLRGHHLHRPPLAEAHHGHLAPRPHRRLAVLRVGPLRGERQLGLPQLAVHEHPTRGLCPHGAPDGADLAYHPLLAGEGAPPFEGARRAQNPEEQATQERRDGHDCAEQHPRVGYARPQQRQSPGEHHDDAHRGGHAVIGHAQVHDQHRDPDKDQEHADRRRYHHRQSAVRPAGGHASKGSIMGPKRLYRASHEYFTRCHRPRSSPQRVAGCGPRTVTKARRGTREPQNDATVTKGPPRHPGASKRRSSVCPIVSVAVREGVAA